MEMRVKKPAFIFNFNVEIVFSFFALYSTRHKDKTFTQGTIGRSLYNSSLEWQNSFLII